MFIKNFLHSNLFPVYFRGCKYINYYFQNKPISFIFKIFIHLPLFSYFRIMLYNKQLLLYICSLLLLLLSSIINFEVIKNFLHSNFFPVYFRGCKYINYYFQNKPISFIFKIFIHLPLFSYFRIMLYNKQLLLYICSLLLLLLSANSHLYGQQIYLKVKGKSISETKYLQENIRDSIFLNGKAVEDELMYMQDFLRTNG